MRNILLILLLVGGLFACNDDDVNVFDVVIPEENIHFTPISGGAVMHYKLPRESDIFAINVRYTDAQGEEVLKVGGYGVDSLIVDGFNERRTGIPARVSLVNHRDEESAATHVTFDTEDSAPYAFFENVKVESYWGGFQVMYQMPQNVSGMAHVFYEGINPLTKLSDTILVTSFPLVKGGDTLLLQVKQSAEAYTVIVRTEDYRGYRVKQKVWTDIAAYTLEKVGLTPSEFIDPYNLAIKDAEDKAGVEYLFDGDMKGEQRLNSSRWQDVFTFVAGPNAIGKPFIIDLKEDKVPAGVRIYGILNTGGSFSGLSYPYYEPQSSLGPIWRSFYYTKLPCEVSVFGGNDEDGDDASWTKLGTFSQSPRLALEERWIERCESNSYRYNNTDLLAAADPAYLEIMFPALPTRYRYLKIVVDDTFEPTIGPVNQNSSGYVTMHELEVFVKKD